MHRVSTVVFRLVADYCGKNRVPTIAASTIRFGGIHYTAKRSQSSDYVAPEVYNPIDKLLILRVFVKPTRLCYNICIVPHCKYLKEQLNMHGHCLYYVVFNVLVMMLLLSFNFEGNNITPKIS